METRTIATTVVALALQRSPANDSLISKLKKACNCLLFSVLIYIRIFKISKQMLLLNLVHNPPKLAGKYATVMRSTSNTKIIQFHTVLCNFHNLIIDCSCFTKRCMTKLVLTTLMYASFKLKYYYFVLIACIVN